MLDLENGASETEIESAKRKLLNALHPDRHPKEQNDIFARMTREVIEAAAFLKGNVGDRANTERSGDVILEDVLFNVRGTQSESAGLVRFEKRYASDKVLAVAVISIDYEFTWSTTPLLGSSQNRSGCALNIVVHNRTSNAIDEFDLGQQCYLIDDRGYQYSPCDVFFYWKEQSVGRFNIHSRFIVPESIVDGFVIFPSLRAGSKNFVRWFLKGNFQIDGQYHRANYDVKLI
jgi:hypothetical protein